MNGFKLHTLMNVLLLGTGLSLAGIPSAVSAAQNEMPISMTNTQSLINLNKADVEALSTLPGIGKKKAAQIIAYRDLNGKFKSVEELVNVKGIGKKMVAKIGAKVSI